MIHVAELSEQHVSGFSFEIPYQIPKKYLT